MWYMHIVVYHLIIKRIKVLISIQQGESQNMLKEKKETSNKATQCMIPFIQNVRIGNFMALDSRLEVDYSCRGRELGEC